MDLNPFEEGRTIQKKKLIFSVLVLLIGTTGFLFIYDFPKKIDDAEPAVQFRMGDPASAVQTTVRIKGTLHRPLFRDPVFTGRFVIDRYAFTEKYQLMDIVFHKRIRNGMGTLVYSYTPHGQNILQSFGAIWMKGDFGQMRILVFEPVEGTKKSSTDLRICAPAQSYEEARAIERALDE